MTRISVIIVSFNAPGFLRVCLDSVRNSMRDLEGEIIVVDNASQEDCVVMVRECFPEVRLIVNEHNEGFSKAVNAGVKQASGEYILILNPDSILPEDGLKNVLEYAQKQENLGAVGCRFIDGSGALLPECKRNFPGISSAAFKLFGLNRGYYANHIEERGIGQVEVLTGAFMFMKRKLFNEMNGFDERFFMFGEDIDLSFRIHLAGYRNHYCGKVSMIHFKGESSVKDLNYLKHFYGALEIFYLKHYKHHAAGRYVLKLLVSAAIRFRSKSVFSERPERNTSRDFAYLGERKPVFEGLKSIFEGSQRICISNIEQVNDDLEGLLFFDSGNIPYSSIVKGFDDLPTKLGKRIISSSGEFYIGSDNPSLPGEIGLIDNKRRESNSHIHGENPVRSGH